VGVGVAVDVSVGVRVPLRVNEGLNDGVGETISGRGEGEALGGIPRRGMVQPLQDIRMKTNETGRNFLSISSPTVYCIGNWQKERGLRLNVTTFSQPGRFNNSHVYY
jgi:hypothetical protein